MNQAILSKKLERAKTRIKILELMIEDKTREAFFAADQLNRSLQSLDKLYRAMPSAMLVVDSNGEITRCNKAAIRMLGYSDKSIIGMRFGIICEALEKIVKLQLDVGKNYQKEHDWITESKQCLPVLVSCSVLDDTDVFDCSYVFIASDLSERKQMEMELRHSQKLESIGQLSAGIAHEINTPMQYIGDNAYFIQDSINDIFSLITLYQNALCQEDISEKLKNEINKNEEDIDLEYLIERVPKAAERTLYGIDRVTDIVSALKAFSHPSNEKVATDINSAILTTLTVAKGEYKHVAEVTPNLGEIPKVVCNPGDINQVLLNLIVNASHAISEKNAKELGAIEIVTEQEEKEIVISVRDTGTGIPEHVRERIFEPFFTTKEVGRGTGQGLSMAYVVIVEKHGGKLHFQTKVNEGTTFFIRLPIL